LSDFSTWNKLSHADEYLIYPKNIGPYVGLDEVSLSNGELYTILSNKLKKAKKGSLVAIIKGVKADNIIKLLKENISESDRKKVKEITLDMAPNMNLIAKKCFKKADIVTDRFHVQSLALDAVQDVRIKYRWEAIKEENKAIKKAKDKGEEYESEQYDNGDTKKQLLARSRYLIFKSREKWTESQTIRAKILFTEFPEIEQAYNLANKLRKIYDTKSTPSEARLKLAKWFNEIELSNISAFNTIQRTVEVNYERILNFFKSRSTNAYAESINSRIKDFRRCLRGVVDVKYFLFRLTKIYA